ncbi:hypothetical protein KSP40_PGU009740 [Platanthera guangdongensis]|uniref:beta-glucosidase n=1 Tax=Platanthera guangdongensis TaxID=2320717 RepID=A0ABR2MNX2_9ASPA
MSSWAAAIDGAEYLKYKDPKQPLNVRLDDLISRMTLTEKIGQMVQIEQANASSEVIKNNFIGKTSLHYTQLSDRKHCFLKRRRGS